MNAKQTKPDAGAVNNPRMKRMERLALEADIVLRDGSTVHVRPTKATDQEHLLAFFRELSERSRTLRFFSRPGDQFLVKAAGRFVATDFANTFGVVALAGLDMKVVGHGMYATTGDGHAEVAVAVADNFQGRGLGTLLVGHLAQVASAYGISAFEAVVLPDNHRMLEVLRESGFPVGVQAQEGELRVTFPTEGTKDARKRFEDRDGTASINAVKACFQPRSIAVVGASRQRGTVAGELFHNLLTSGFPGPVFPVNPNAKTVQSVPAYPTVEDIPGPVDLAVIVVPAPYVAPIAEQCGRKGVRALVVISAGFAETGEEGRARQADLLRLCRAAGMRLIGPNCIGIVSTDPDALLNATFAPSAPVAGPLGFASQSGALGLALVDYLSTLGLGLSSFVSLGNKADISGNDLISYWESDPRTGVILLYLESLGNPRKFSRISRRVARAKPIVIVKSGRSVAGARASASHTGALLASSDITVDALFRQAGVIRTDSLPEMFDVASLVARQPLPKGRRVAIISNAGGPAILCADACEASELEVPLLSEESRDRLRAILPAHATVANPVDMIASATSDHYRDTIRIVANDPGVDALIVLYTPAIGTSSVQVARAIADAELETGKGKPVLAVFITARGAPAEIKAAGIPSYGFPEAAAIALAHVTRYAMWRGRPLGEPPRLEGVRRDEAAAIVAFALGRGEGWLTPDEVASLFLCYGLPMIEQRIVASPEEAARAAEEIGGDVALKGIAPGVLHKTDVGAVRLNLRGGETVRRTAEEMAARLRSVGHAVSHFVVQRMASDGVEMIAGVVHDPQFGPVLVCGTGGTLVELLRDVSVRLTPITSEDASEMVRSLKTYPLLTGYRGRPRCNVPALEKVLLRLSALVEDRPEIAELDCNPIMVDEGGAAVVDARVRVTMHRPPLPLGARG